MNDTKMAALSALVDGETVATEILLAALQELDARQVLIDFVRLRSELAADEGTPRESFERSAPRALAAAAARWARRPWLRLAAALALVTVSLWLVVRPAAPPEHEAPPEPSRVLYFEPGVDWHDRSAPEEVRP